jgi:hypothetical protein
MNKAISVQLDTNVALDDMLERQPFCVDAKRILFMALQMFCFGVGYHRYILYYQQGVAKLGNPRPGRLC